MEELKATDEYEHQLVVVEGGDCKCGSHHEEGHALWGGRLHPDEMPVNAFETVRGIHSVGVEYRNA
jgi:hypothetical protein